MARPSPLARVRRIFVPADTSTESGRSNERYRRAALTAVASAGATATSVGVALVSIPLALGYLGKERYGLWMTINSMAVLVLTLGDLGLGNALVNRVSDAHGRDDRGAAATAVSSAFYLLSAIAIGLAVVFSLVYPIVPWDDVFNVTERSGADEAGPAAAVLFGCFLLNLPLGVVLRARLGLQEGFTNSVWTAAGSVLGLASLFVAIHLRVGLPLLVLAVAGGPVVASVANAAVLFLRQRPWLRPRLASVERGAARRLVGAGLLFFAVQVMWTLTYSSDSLIAAHVLGPESVTEYMVPFRLFSLAPMLVGLVLVPLWPAYGESMARGEPGWVRTTFLRSLQVGVAVPAVASAFLVVCGPFLFELWVGDKVRPSLSLLLGLAVWTVILGSGSAIATLLNSLNVLRVQVVVGAITTAAAIGIKIVLAQRFGVPGIAWGMVAAYVVCAVLPYAILVPRLLRELRGRATPVSLDAETTAPPGA